MRHALAQPQKYRSRIPEFLRTDNGPNLISQEIFLEEQVVFHKTNIPLWPRASGKVERQNK